MPSLRMIMDGEGAWPDLADKRMQNLLIDGMGNETAVSMAPLEGGMASGKVSVTFRVDLTDGRTVLFETSLALLESAVRAFTARFGSQV